MHGINLIPVRRLMYRRTRRHLRGWALILTAAALLMALTCGYLRARVPVARATDAELAKVSARLGQLHAGFSAASGVETELNLNRSILALLKDQPDWSLLLELLAAQTDEQTVLREIRLTPLTQLTLASTPPAPSSIAKRADKAAVAAKLDLPSRFKLELRGLCKTPAGVSRFVANIENLGVMSEVKLIRTGREPFLSDIASSFELECVLGEVRGGK
jgi:Tfp pilus assembly protein PilN